MQPTPTNAFDDWMQVYMTRAGSGFFPVNAPVRISHSWYDVNTQTTMYGVVSVVDDTVTADLPQSSLYRPAANPTPTHTPDYANWRTGELLQLVERVENLPAYMQVTLQDSRPDGVYVVRSSSGVVVEAQASQLIEWQEP